MPERGASYPAGDARGRDLYREAALRHHAAARELGLLPPLARPRVVAVLWALVALLALALAAAARLEVPAFAAGQAVVTEVRPAPSGGIVLGVALLLPAEARSGLRPGQAVSVDVDGGAGRWDGTIVSVEPGVLGPEAARASCALPPGIGPVPSAPVALARARLAAAAATRPGALLWTAHPATVRVGVRSLGGLALERGGRR